MNAGIVRFLEREDVVGPGGPASASMLAHRGLPLTRTERAAFFARHAIEESLELVGDQSGHPLACVLALPSPGVGPRIDLDRLWDHLLQARTGTGATAHLRLHGVVEEGRAGIFQALEAAVSLLALGRENLVLVAGIDSRVDTDTLRALAGRNRLLSRSNRDGIIPGEGAGCVLIGHPEAVPRHHSLAVLRSNAVAREPVPFVDGGNKVTTGVGLASVFQSFVHEVGGRVGEVFAGTTGQIFFGREFAHAYLRSAPLMPEPLRQQTLSSSLGDVGAAAGAICAVQAIMRLGPPGPGNRGLPIHSSLAYASSDDGLVGGCVFEAPS